MPGKIKAIRSPYCKTILMSLLSTPFPRTKEQKRVSLCYGQTKHRPLCRADRGRYYQAAAAIVRCVGKRMVCPHAQMCILIASRLEALQQSDLHINTYTFPSFPSSRLVRPNVLPLLVKKWNLYPGGALPFVILMQKER